jgi:hypothetical protein
LSIGDVGTAFELVGNALGEVLQGMTASDAAKLGHALATCTVVESTPTFQVCAVPDDEFMFVFVRDEKKSWRILAW